MRYPPPIEAGEISWPLYSKYAKDGLFLAWPFLRSRLIYFKIIIEG